MVTFILCAPGESRPGPCVPLLGQVRPTCHCAKYLWRFLSPSGPRLCPEAGRTRRGKYSQGGPQAVSVHYGYRDGTWPAGGQTFSCFLLRSSAAPLGSCAGGWMFESVTTGRPQDLTYEFKHVHILYLTPRVRLNVSDYLYSCVYLRIFKRLCLYTVFTNVQ